MTTSTSAKAPAKQKLGKGLSALIGDTAVKADALEKAAPTGGKAGKASPSEESVTVLSLANVQPGEFQPRQYFDEEPLRELADSLRKNGVIQPIIVRELSAGKYQIIAGERRWRASKLAGLETIPAIIKKLSDRDALELALVENVQRQDLTAIEEAEGYQRLMDEFAYTQEELAAVIGKSRSHIANTLRLVELPDGVKAMVNDGSLTMGHARALLKTEKPLELAEQIKRRGLSVRQAEQLTRRGEIVPITANPPARKGNKPGGAAVPAVQKDADLLALEEVLSRNLGMKVDIEDANSGEGRVIITFQSLQQLDKVLQRLGGRI